MNYFGACLRFKNVFRKENFGHGSYVNYMLEACDGLGITGSGDLDHMTRHGGGAAVINQLFESGQDEVSISMGSGHR